MSPALKEKINQYRQDGKNLFSYSEKVMIALICEDLHDELMPFQYLRNPMPAFFNVLDADQQQLVLMHHQGGWNANS